jgi:glycosyltransferase involved in cell wall biosynthesis
MTLAPDALSLCMIVRNEERQLQACLDSVSGLVGEIVLVDTGSTDGTGEIAAHNGAKWIPFDFTFVDFAAARNHGLAHATGRWILALDADETLDRAGIPLIEALVVRNENAGYYVERHNRSGQTSTTDYAVRLFPNRTEHRYRGRVHETVDASILALGGRLRKTEIRIDHNFSSDPESRRSRNRWYIEILMEEIAADPTDDTRLDFLAAEYHQLEMFTEAAEIAERIVVARPEDPRAHLNAGIYHLMYKPDMAQAHKDFTRALELKPGYAEAASFLETLTAREKEDGAEPGFTGQARGPTFRG